MALLGKDAGLVYDGDWHSDHDLAMKQVQGGHRKDYEIKVAFFKIKKFREATKYLFLPEVNPLPHLHGQERNRKISEINKRIQLQNLMIECNFLED